jgi:hypothetical protein
MNASCLLLLFIGICLCLLTIWSFIKVKGEADANRTSLFKTFDTVAIQQKQRLRSPVIKLAGIYNIVPNVVWSAINLTPVIAFCVGEIKTLYILLLFGISLFMGMLPISFFNYIQVSYSTTFYKNIGIKFVRKYTQDGDLVNRLIRKKFGYYKVIRDNRSAESYISRTYSYERFHFIFFTFFILVSLVALTRKDFYQFMLIMITNILYNIYPILLQQYNRIRIMNISIRKRNQKVQMNT